MTAPLFNLINVGGSVTVGTSRDLYWDFLVEGEEVWKEYNAVRDVLLFTNLRIMILDVQGFSGQKTHIISVPWTSITAFSVKHTEASRAELKICGLGFGICALSFAIGTDMRDITAFIHKKLFLSPPDS